MTARLYLNLGITYECKEEFNEAIKYFEKAMSICRHNDFWELLHKCYLDEALLYFNKLDDQSKALQLLNSAINIAERLTTDRTVRVCQTLLAKSEVLMKMADFQGAKQILHKAYKMKTPDEGDAESIETNLKIGKIHIRYNHEVEKFGSQSAQLPLFMLQLLQCAKLKMLSSPLI